MRILLRDRRTRLYWAGGGKWTRFQDQAFNFHTSSDAFHFATHRPVLDLEVVLASPEPSLGSELLTADRAA